MKSALRPFVANRASAQDKARLYQLLASFLACLALTWLGLPVFFDQVPRLASANLSPVAPSGRIVLVDIDAERSFANETMAQRQAQAVSLVAAANPERILIDGKFDVGDAGIPALGKAIQRSKVPITIAWPVEYKGGETVAGRRAAFPGVEEVADSYHVQWNSFITEARSSIDVGGRRWKTFAASVSGVKNPPESFSVDYRHRADDIESYALEQLIEDPALVASLQGKRVVISLDSSNADSGIVIPGQVRAPLVNLTIIAAETLIGGGPTVVPSWITLALALMLLCAISLLPRRIRRVGYAIVVAVLVLVPYALTPFGYIAETGQALVLSLIYLTMRLRNLWKERAAGVERLSGLPNFHSLEDDFSLTSGRLVVAKVQNYEEILASLEPSRHAGFIHQIAQRLAVGGSTKIYTDTTGHFAWFDDLEHAKSHVSGLLALTSAPIVLGNRTLDFACSFGLLDCRIEKPRQAISATTVAANQAAERPTRTAYVSEQEGLDKTWQLSLLASLDDAISKEQVYLVFQGQHRLSDGKIVGVEALVRWRHPERGVISPAQFIPQIERAGRLKPLTAHTLRLAARASNGLAASDIKVSVNVSATLVSADDFPVFVKENILAAGGRPSNIVIEITETARIPNLERAARNLEKLQEEGFEIALDDFGTGEANLSLLVALPCDELKIDRSFIVLAQHSDRARMVISALCRTARLSDMRLIAEGIENEDDRTVLHQLGAEIGQGYLFGKPQHFAQFAAAVAMGKNPQEKVTLY